MDAETIVWLQSGNPPLQIAAIKLLAVQNDNDQVMRLLGRRGSGWTKIQAAAQACVVAFTCKHEACGKCFSHRGNFVQHTRTAITAEQPYACEHEGAHHAPLAS